jgi:hypothetical protein
VAQTQQIKDVLSAAGFLQHILCIDLLRHTTAFHPDVICKVAAAG